MSHGILNVIIGIVAFIVCPLAGGLLSGLDRKITARMQGRKGPPVIQPFYDVLKLLGKERLAVNRMQDLYAVGFPAFMAAAVIMLFTGSDLLMLAFVMTFGSVCLIMGAMSARSPFSRIGAQREIIQLMAAEPIILLVAVGAYLATGSFRIETIVRSGPLIAKMPLFLFAMLIVLAIKLRKSPFDFSTSEHGHQELVKGLTMEFSGAQMAAIEIGEWYELILLFGIVALFWAKPLGAGIAVAAIVYLFEILLDNICARTTWVWMLKVAGFLGLGLSVVNLAALYLWHI